MDDEYIQVDPAELTLDMSADVPVTNATVLGGEQLNSKLDVLHQNHDFKASDELRSAGVLSTFIGCYSEAAINDVRFPSLVLGGALAETPIYQAAVFTLNGGIMSRGNLVYWPDDRSWRLDVGPGNGLASSKSAITVQNGLGDRWELFYEDVHGTWGWRRNGSGIWSMGFPTAVTNIRSPTSTIFRTGSTSDNQAARTLRIVRWWLLFRVRPPLAASGIRGILCSTQVPRRAGERLRLLDGCV